MAEGRNPWRIAGAVLLAVAAAVVLALPRPTQRRFPERQEVRFWHQWSGEWKDVIDKIVARFNASQTEYELIALSVPGAASTKCLLGVAGGDPPDVMAQWEAVIPTWAEKKVILPLDTLLTPEEYARFKRTAYPGVLRLGTYAGHLYAMTPTMNLWACYIDPEQTAEIGWDPAKDWPKTLEELYERCKKLDQFDRDGNLTRLGLTLGDWRYIAPLFGGKFYDYEKGRITINTPENVRALEYLARDRKRLGQDNVTRFISAFGPDFGANWSFLAGKQSVDMEGQWRVEQIRKVAPDRPYLVRPMPPPKGGVPLAGFTNGNQMIVPAGAKNPKGAMAFIKFWAGLDNPDRGAEFVTWGGWLPMTKEVADSPTYQRYIRQNPQFRVFVDMMPSDKFYPLPPVTVQMFIQDRLGKYGDLALRGSITAAEAARQCQADVDREIARRKELGYD